MNRRVGGWIAADLVVLVLALFPVLWIISLSLKTPAQVGDGRLIPSEFSFDNYECIFAQGVCPDALRSAIGIALIATVVAVSLASLAAYAIARLEFPGKALVLLSALAIAMFPPISIVGPLYELWRNIGLFDTW